MRFATNGLPDVDYFSTGNFDICYRASYKSEKLIEFLDNPNCILDNPNYHYFDLKPARIKDTTTVIAIRDPSPIGTPIVIKRYNKKNTWHAFRRTVQTSRAENCWYYAHKLEKLGFSVAPPIAFIQEYLGAGLKGQSWYLTEFVEGLWCLDYLPRIDNHSSCKEVMGQIVNTLKTLWTHQITHGDLKGSNILISGDDIVLLDLDAMKQHRNPVVSRARIDKDVERFLRNWKDRYPVLYQMAKEQLCATGFLRTHA